MNYVVHISHLSTSASENLSLGRPSINRMTFLSLSNESSSFCVLIVQCTLRRLCNTLKPEVGVKNSFRKNEFISDVQYYGTFTFFEVLNKIILLSSRAEKLSVNLALS